MKRLIRLLQVLCLVFIVNETHSQSMGIGTETPNTNSVLHLVSPNNDQGLLITQLTTAQRTATSFVSRLTAADNGLLVFDIDENAFYYWHNDSWQSMRTSVNISAGSGISIDNGQINNTGDLDATNEIQNLSLSGTSLSISNGNTIDLSAIDTNTQLDEAAVDAFVANNGYLTSVDLSGYDSDSSDDFDGDYSSLVNAPTSLSQFTNDVGYITSPNDADSNVSNELISNVSLETGNILRITDAGGNYDVDLSGLQDGTGTDSQDLSFDGTNLNISGGTGIDISGWDTDASDDFDGNYSSLTGAPTSVSAFTNDAGYITSPNDGDTDDTNELITVVSLETGNILRITDAGGNNDVDLSSLQDGTGTDSQNLSFDGTNLNISGGTGIDVSGWDTDASDDFDGNYSSLTGAPTNVSAFTNDAGYITSPNDADADDTNELITAISLEPGNILRVTDAGGNNDVDLSSLQDGTGTDDQNASEVPVTPANGVTSTNVQAALEELQSEIASSGGGDMLEAVYDTDGDNIVDNSELVNGLTVETAVPLSASFTDSQNLSFDGSNLNISGGTGIDVSGWDTDNTDDFDGNYSSLSGAPTNISAFTNDAGYITSPNDADADASNELISAASLLGTTLRITDAGGNNDVDLSSLQDGTGTDSQSLSFDGTNLNISGGTGIDVSGWDTDNTDDFDGNYSSLSGAPTNVSAFTNDAGYITSPNDADADASNELISAASLLGTTLRITDAGGNNDVDLSSLQDGTGTDSQSLSFDGTNLNISGGTGIDVSGWDTDNTDDFDGNYSSLSGAPTNVSAFTNDAGYITSPNDADADASNELLTSGAMSGNTLRLFEGSNNINIDLSQFDELPSQSGNSGRYLTTNGTSPSWASLTSSQWTTSGSNIYFTGGDVGIGTSSPQKPLHVVENVTAIDGSDGAYLDIQNLNANPDALAGIRFKTNSSVGSTTYKGGIFFERGGLDGNNSGFGSIILAMNTNDNTTNVTPADAKFAIGPAGASVTGSLSVTDFFDVDNTATFDGTIRTNAVLDINNEMQVGNGSGTAGYILESAGPGTAPLWQAPIWDVTYGTTDYIFYGPGIGTARMGLGTSSPSTNLEIQTGLVLTPAIEIEATATTSEEASIRYLTTKNTFVAGVNGSGDYTIMDGNNLNTGSARMSITSGGVIGFNGTLAMSQALQHTGDTDTDLQFFTDRIQLRAGGRTMIDLQEGTSDYIVLNSTNILASSTSFDINTRFYAALNTASVSSGTNQVRIINSTDELVEYIPSVCPFLYVDHGNGYQREGNIIEAQAHKYLERLQSTIIPLDENLPEVKIKISLEEPETSYVDYLAVVIYKYDSINQQELVDTLEVKSSSTALDKLTYIDHQYYIMQMGDSFEVVYDRSELMQGDFQAYVLSSGYYDIDFQAYQKQEWRELKYERFAEKAFDLNENGQIVQFRPHHIVNPANYGYENPEYLLRVDGPVSISNQGSLLGDRFTLEGTGRSFFSQQSENLEDVNSELVEDLLKQKALTNGNRISLDFNLLKTYFPQLVNDKDQVAQSELVPLLIEAIKKQSEEIDLLKKQLSGTENELDQIRAQITEITSLINQKGN